MAYLLGIVQVFLFIHLFLKYLFIYLFWIFLDIH